MTYGCNFLEQELIVHKKSFNPVCIGDFKINLIMSIINYLFIMFMLYSGEFNFGSSSSVSPSRLSAAGDVLIVTIQYRLGALGFLHLDGDVVSANLGLQDQILSIEWISQNIIHFGGDPTRVTLFGSEVTFNCLYFTFTVNYL